MAHRIRSGHTVSTSSGETYRDDQGNDVVVPAGAYVVRNADGKPRHAIPRDTFEDVFEEVPDDSPANADRDVDTRNE